MSQPRVYVPTIEWTRTVDGARANDGLVVALPEDEAHHVARVLRLGSGDAVTLFDGRGHSWPAVLADVGKRSVTARIDAAPAIEPSPAAKITLAIGVLKGEAMDVVVRDATVLGVSAILPMMTSHVVVPKRARGDEAIDRWQRVAVAAAKQCGRSMLPEICDVAEFAAVVGYDADTRVICLEPSLAGDDLTAIASESVLVMIGPEGGWSSDEVATARRAGFHGITIGDFTLRAELAPVVAVTRVWAALNR